MSKAVWPSDRMLHGSYIELRDREESTRQAEIRQKTEHLGDFY